MLVNVGVPTAVPGVLLIDIEVNVGVHIAGVSMPVSVRVCVMRNDEGTD